MKEKNKNKNKFYSFSILLLLSLYILFSFSGIKYPKEISEIEKYFPSLYSGGIIYLFYFLLIVLLNLFSLFFLLAKKIDKTPLFESFSFSLKDYFSNHEYNKKILLLILLLLFTFEFVYSCCKSNISSVFLNLLWELIPLLIIPNAFPKKALGFNIKNFSPFKTAIFYFSLIFLLFFLSFLNFLILKNFPLKERIHPVVFLFFSLRNKFLLLLLSIQVILLGPLSEEVLFRGFIFNWLRSKFSFKISAFFVSFIFAFLHFLPFQFLPIFFLSLFLSFIYEKTHNLLNCIFFHSLHNFVIFLPLLLHFFIH